MAVTMFCEYASVNRGLAIYSVGTRLVYCHGIERRKHSHIGDYGYIVFRMAIAKRRNIYYKAYMETWPIPYNRFSVLGNFTV